MIQFLQWRNAQKAVEIYVFADFWTMSRPYRQHTVSFSSHGSAHEGHASTVNLAHAGLRIRRLSAWRSCVDRWLGAWQFECHTAQRTPTLWSTVRAQKQKFCYVSLICQLSVLYITINSCLFNFNNEHFWKHCEKVFRSRNVKEVHQCSSSSSFNQLTNPQITDNQFFAAVCGLLDGDKVRTRDWRSGSSGSWCRCFLGENLWGFTYQDYRFWRLLLRNRRFNNQASAKVID